MRTRRWRIFRVIYLLVFVSLLAIAAPFVMKYFKLLNDLSGQK